MKRIKKTLSLALALALMICLSLCLTTGALAVENSAVQQAADGVFRVMAYFTNEAFYDHYIYLDEYDEPVRRADVMSNPGPISMGTAFLIGYSESGQPVLVTNYHVVENQDAFLYYDENGVTLSNVKTYDRFTVAVMGDLELTAEVKYSSENYDFAILYVDGTIANKTVLSINPNTQGTTTDCYALGFPGVLDVLLDDMDFTTDSVTVTQGTISNVTTISTERATNIPVYQTTATISGGDSGGPLVNSDGEVIGINSYSYTTAEASNYYYAIRIDQICRALDLLGVQYNESAGTTKAEPEKEEKPVKTEEAVAEPTEAPVVEAVKPTPAPVEPEEEEEAEGGSNILLFVIIAVILVIAIVVVAIVVASGKKKKASNARPSYPQQQYIGGDKGGYGSNTSDMPTGLLDNSADQATTVLVGGAGGAAMCLVRESNGEKIYLNKSVFRIGRDRNRVDYVISDNTAISRSHAAIVSRGGEFFVIDNNTANHTYINDNVLPANGETAIHEGDTLRLANERFRFEKA